MDNELTEKDIKKIIFFKLNSLTKISPITKNPEVKNRIKNKLKIIGITLNKNIEHEVNFSFLKK